MQNVKSYFSHADGTDPGFFENDPPKKLGTPAEIRSPEMIFDCHISTAQDCWAFGCLVYNVLTNAYPFELQFMYSKESRDDSHLMQLSSVLGPLPAKLKNSWSRYGTYFDESGNMKKFDVDDDTYSYSEFDNLPAEDRRSTASGAENAVHEERDEEDPSITPPTHLGKPSEYFDPELYPSIFKVFKFKARQDHDDPQSIAEYTALNPPLRERWLDEKHPDMELDESKLVLDLLQRIFTYDPGQRLKTKEILQHAWIRDYCASGNEGGRILGKEVTVTRNKRKRSNEDEK
jgi:serine/threonine protein kinase